MKKDKNNKKIIETVVTSGTFVFVAQAALQGIVSWISAHIFSKFWNKWFAKKTEEVNETDEPVK